MLAGLTNPGAPPWQGVREALAGLEGTYIYYNKVLISTSTREDHKATLQEVLVHLHVDENGSQLDEGSSGQKGVPLLGHVPA